MEQKAEEAQQQKGLIKRYLKAYNADMVGNAEIDLMWRIGRQATHQQIKTINAQTPKAIASVSKAIETQTTNFLESYANSLINRGGNNEK